MKHVKCYKEGYPRPQLVRAGWTDLSGEWDFAFDREGEGEHCGWNQGFDSQTKITVPFAVQTKASGIAEEKLCRSVWYQKKVALHCVAGTHILLHFEGVDYFTRVWVNGSFAGEHAGAYERFSFEIGHLLRDGENVIVVNATDSYCLTQPRGKQRWKEESFTCHYTDTTGIWKTVWLEEVPAAYVRSLQYISFDGGVNCIAETAGGKAGDCVVIDVSGEESFSAPIDENGRAVIRMCFQEAKFWSCEDPFLYDATVRFGTDCVGTYFGIAVYGTEKGKFLCNGRTVYPKMLLLQGYWKDSGMTCPSESALLRDLEKIRCVGANGVRMHQKTEDERFYYYADLLGMLVWAEMPSAFRFLPAAIAQNAQEYFCILSQFGSHPCVQAFVAFNESWGIEDVMTQPSQRALADALYQYTKSVHPDKLCVGNDGWEGVSTDIVTVHDYAQEAQVLFGNLTKRLHALSAGLPCGEGRETLAESKYYTGQPFMVSEYGGVSFTPSADSWGYGKGAQSGKDFHERLYSLTKAVRDCGAAGYCLTQATDCEQEKNGLMDSERNFKIDIKFLRDIFAL